MVTFYIYWCNITPIDEVMQEVFKTLCKSIRYRFFLKIMIGFSEFVIMYRKRGLI